MNPKSNTIKDIEEIECKHNLNNEVFEQENGNSNEKTAESNQLVSSGKKYLHI